MGIWVGKASDSDEHIIATENGIKLGRSVRAVVSEVVPENFYEKIAWTIPSGQKVEEPKTQRGREEEDDVGRREQGGGAAKTPLPRAVGESRTAPGGKQGGGAAKTRLPRAVGESHTAPGGKQGGEDAKTSGEGVEEAASEEAQAAGGPGVARDPHRTIGGAATRRSRELEAYLDARGPTPACSGCKRSWLQVGGQQKPTGSVKHSTACRDRRRAWEAALLPQKRAQNDAEELREVRQRPPDDIVMGEEPGGGGDAGDEMDQEVVDCEIERGLKRARDEDEREDMEIQRELQMMELLIASVSGQVFPGMTPSRVSPSTNI